MATQSEYRFETDATLQTETVFDESDFQLFSLSRISLFTYNRNKIVEITCLIQAIVEKLFFSPITPQGFHNSSKKTWFFVDFS